MARNSKGLPQDRRLGLVRRVQDMALAPRGAKAKQGRLIWGERERTRPDGKGALPKGVLLARCLTFREKDPNLLVCRYFLCEDCLTLLQIGTGKPRSLEAQQWGA